jgi:hypothetical protein
MSKTGRRASREGWRTVEAVKIGNTLVLACDEEEILPEYLRYLLLAYNVPDGVRVLFAGKDMERLESLLDRSK